jgi:5-methylcytosine-specific restriction endonuclease McrA
MTRSQGKQCRKWTIQVVHIQDPSINSPAHLALLAKHYSQQDTTIYTESRMGRIRNRWMKSLIKNAASGQGLTCAICGREKLFPHSKDPYRRNLATLDHRIDIGHGGDWRDPSNFQVACYRCNQRKSK